MTKYYVVLVHKVTIAGFNDYETAMVDMTYVAEGSNRYIRRERFFLTDKWEKVERVGYFEV